MSFAPSWTLDPRLAARIAEIEARGEIAHARNDLSLVVTDPRSRKQREMWGTIRMLLGNSIQGVTTGHQSKLTLKGVGYRGMLLEDGKLLELRVGYDHAVNLPIPEGIQVTMVNPTMFEVFCIDKEKLGMFCASVRRIRPPEPYKGKVCHIQLTLLITGYLCGRRNH